MKILIADDNLIFQTVLHKILTGWGYTTVGASDGEEAWHILQAESGPRLAILDWVMPRMDGVEVCRRVRVRESGHYTYILILTGKTASEDLITAMEAGADDFVSKPLKSAELRARLRAGCRILGLQEGLLRAGCSSLPVPTSDLSFPSWKATGCAPDSGEAANGRPSLAQEWAPPSTLLEAAAGDHGVIAEVLETFRTDTAARFERLRTALTDSDFSRMRVEAHTIRGGARQVGADALADACQELEAIVGLPQATLVAATLTRLQDLFEKTCHAMASPILMP